MECGDPGSDPFIPHAKRFSSRYVAYDPDNPKKRYISTDLTLYLDKDTLTWRRY